MNIEIKPVLSIGMIFKNEIRCLERCMKSLQPLRDAIPCELVMADTGSDDGSREVAEKYADILIDFPWINDFAAARNAVMDRCSGQWYFSLDCDEWLDPNIAGLVNFLTGQHEYNYGSIVIRNYSTEELERGSYGDFVGVRLLRMSTGLRYAGAIHERWETSDAMNIMLPKGAMLHHDGYVGGERWKSKEERNMPLLRKKMKGNPKDLGLLQQCIESGGTDPHVLDYVYRAVKGVKEKWVGWELFGPSVFRLAVRFALERKLPELEEWLAKAEELFPNNLFIRVDVMYFAVSRAWDKGEYAEAIRCSEIYLKAIEDYQAGTYNYADLLTSALSMGSPTSVLNVGVVLAAAYVNSEQPEECLRILKTMDGSQMTVGQARNWLNTCCQLHAKSKEDTEPVLAAFWEQIQQGEKKELAEQRRAEFIRVGMEKFPQAYRDEEAVMRDFCRYAYTAFLPLAGKENCELGTAAAVLSTFEPKKLTELLLSVKKWGEFPAGALEHALLGGVEFPLPGKHLNLEEMDALVGRMDSSVRESLAIQAADRQLDSWQILTWVRGLALAAVRGCQWENEAKGLELSRAFARIEGVFLPRYYAPELLSEENIQVLPPLHRFGWYCAQAFEQLDSGDAAGYVHLLREGLSVCESMKPMVEFLTKHTPELQAPKPSTELLALAEQVRTLLAACNPEDPAVEAVKASEAYQKVAHLIEGIDGGGLPS